MNNDEEGIELAPALQQRDQAVACMLLSLAIALALVLTNRGPDRKTEAALAVVGQHKALLAQNEQVLHANEAELAQDLATLENIRRAHHGPSR